MRFGYQSVCIADAAAGCRVEAIENNSEHADLAAAREEALAADVGYQDGTLFAPDGISGRNYARLCFGYNTPEEIHEGIARLAEVFGRKGILES